MADICDICNEDKDSTKVYEHLQQKICWICVMKIMSMWEEPIEAPIKIEEKLPVEIPVEKEENNE